MQQLLVFLWIVTENKKIRREDINNILFWLLETVISAHSWPIFGPLLCMLKYNVNIE